MATETFAESLRHVLKYEGGYANHPADPGGATMRGVTFRTYNAYRKRKGLPTRSVRLITSAEIADVYRGMYWDAVKGDQLPAGVDFVVFDGAVNSGPSASVKWLQRALGVKVDGVIGQATLRAANEHPDHDRLIAAVLDRRMAFLRALRTWRTFGKGWTSRLAQVRKTGQAMASGSVGPAPVYKTGMHRKAIVEDAKTVPGKSAAAAVTGAGGATTAITPITDALGGFSDKLPMIATVVAVLTALAAAATAGGLAYAWWAKRKQAELDDALGLVPPPAPEQSDADEDEIDEDEAPELDAAEAA